MNRPISQLPVEASQSDDLWIPVLKPSGALFLNRRQKLQVTLGGRLRTDLSNVGAVADAAAFRTAIGAAESGVSGITEADALALIATWARESNPSGAVPEARLSGATLVTVLAALAGAARLPGSAVRDLVGAVNAETGTIDAARIDAAIARDAEVTTAVDGLRDGVSGAFDTLAELAAARIDAVSLTLSGQDLTVTVGRAGLGDIASAAVTLPAAGVAATLHRFRAPLSERTAVALSGSFVNACLIGASVENTDGQFTVTTAGGVSTVEVLAAGYYLLAAGVRVDKTSGTTRSEPMGRFGIQRSGAVVAGTELTWGGGYIRATSGADTAHLSGVIGVPLEAGDRVTVQVAEEDNTGNTFTIGGAGSYLHVIQVG